MKSFLLTFISVLMLGAVQLTPVVAVAAPQSLFLVTCGEANPKAQPVDPTKPGGEKECGFLDAIAEVKLLINTFFILSVPITVIAIAVSGVQILLAQGNMAKIKDARIRVQNILIGFVIILSAWLIVYTITSQLLKPEFYTPFLGK